MSMTGDWKIPLQWGHRNSSVEIGAAMRRRRIGSLASMGPPKFIGGNETLPSNQSRRNKCFNGATEIHRWKYESGVLKYTEYDMLQWGHRNSSVEIKQNKQEKGNKTMLQWGHRNSSVEIRASRPKWRAGISFNGATEIHRWK